MRTKPPSFDFYPDDFSSGTMGMHPLARGVYISLLCYQWSYGCIPKADDTRKLVQVTGAMPEELAEHLPEVLKKFKPNEDGTLFNERLESEYKRKCEIREKRANNGRKGGEANAKQMLQQKRSKTGSRKKEVGSRKKKENEWVIPDSLDSPKVRELLDDFAAMRRTIKKPIRDFARTSKVLNQFDNQDHLIFALETCIANDYQGLKPDYRRPVNRSTKKTELDLP